MMLKNSFDFSVEETVGKSHGQALGREENCSEMKKNKIEDRVGVRRSDYCNEVGDAKQGNDNQQRLSSPPVLMIRGLSLPSGAELGHNNIKY